MFFVPEKLLSLSILRLPGAGFAVWLAPKPGINKTRFWRKPQRHCANLPETSAAEETLFPLGEMR
jgi:hypothetical protein